MDLKAKYLSDKCSDPIEFLNQLRQTTEPIGGSTVYDEDGEFVEYDVAIEAVKKANDAFIEKAEKFFTEKFEVEDYNDHIDIDGTPIFSYGRFIEDFRKYMKGE